MVGIMTHIYFLRSIVFLSFFDACASVDEIENVSINCSREIIDSGDKRFIPYKLQDSYEKNSDAKNGIYIFGATPTNVTRLDNGYIPSDEQSLLTVTRQSWVSRMSTIFPHVDKLTLKQMENAPALPPIYNDETVKNFGHLPESIRTLIVEFSEPNFDIYSSQRLHSKFEHVLRVLCAACPPALESLTIKYSGHEGAEFDTQTILKNLDFWHQYFPKSLSKVYVTSNNFDDFKFNLLKERLIHSGAEEIYVNGLAHTLQKKVRFLDALFNLDPLVEYSGEEVEDSSDDEDEILSVALNSLELKHFAKANDPVQYGNGSRFVVRTISWNDVNDFLAHRKFEYVEPVSPRRISTKNRKLERNRRNAIIGIDTIEVVERKSFSLEAEK